MQCFRFYKLIKNIKSYECLTGLRVLTKLWSSPSKSGLRERVRVFDPTRRAPRLAAAQQLTLCGTALCKCNRQFHSTTYLAFVSLRHRTHLRLHLLDFCEVLFLRLFKCADESTAQQNLKGEHHKTNCKTNLHFHTDI